MEIKACPEHQGGYGYVGTVGLKGFGFHQKSALQIVSEETESCIVGKR